MVPMSVLDLSPVPSGVPQSQALLNTIDLAKHAESLGYRRVWLAEHHGIPSVASSAPEVLIGHVASATNRIRVGSGGIMLPNHAPLRVVEEFKVLEGLHPGRIDLGLGRAPGTDQLTAYALRRSREALVADDFSEQLGELLAFGGERPWAEDHPFRRIQAIPTDVPLPPVFLLGSSDYSAQASALAGLGFAFAAHISPSGAVDAMRAYRERFVPYHEGDRPHAILALSVVVGEDDEDAERLSAPGKLSFVRLRTGNPGPIPTIEEALSYEYSAHELAVLKGIERSLITGGPETVRAKLEERIIATQADEVMVTGNIHGHEDRKASYTRLAEAMDVTAAEPSPARATA